MLDRNLNLYGHIKAKCRVACYNLYKVIKIRKYLSLDSCKILMQALVISHFDYGNSLYIGLPDKAIKLMCRVQNMAAKIAMKRCKYMYDSSADSLKTLHWLPIPYRIQFKVLTLVHKCINDGAPEYLSSLVHKTRGTYPARNKDLNKYCLLYTSDAADD